MERLKGKFTQRWLSDSDLYYCPIFERLFYAQYHYLKRKGVELKPEHLHRLGDEEALTEAEAEAEAEGNDYRALFTIEGGLDEFHHLADSIDALNRGFITLLEAPRSEPLAAMPLVRLQLDNLTYLAAELKYPFRVLYRVFNTQRTRSGSSACPRMCGSAGRGERARR